MTGLRQQAAQGLALGDKVTVTRTFSYEDTLAFGELTQDYNPVHYDLGFAQGKGFAGLILHGLLTGAMICQIGGQVAWLASGMNFRFKRPVAPGDTVTLEFTLTALDQGGRARGRGRYTNQRGELVMEAELFGQLPGEDDRARLEEMMAQGDPDNPLRGE
ncbi:MAG: acyl dehydratase [Deltaproteobacteria bacterium]|nr:acyl dehydratase [Deltaproteobacteria bacterium]